VPQTVPLSVQVIAETRFTPPVDVPWRTDAEGGQALAEFAGRACYQAWDKANPATATNEGYLRHMLEVGHLAVLEHASVSLYVTGLSRSVAAELVRHRHFSFSQLSQRHVPDQEANVVEPPVIAEDPELHDRFVAAADAALAAYEALLAGLEKRLATAPNSTAPNSTAPNSTAPNSTLRRKQARQAARAVLPTALETRLVVTGNYRAWRHFIAMRASEHADVEMRELAMACLRALQAVAPHVFGDFRISRLADGTEVAASPYVAEL
jgi:thymidylate synthase (FAD)